MTPGTAGRRLRSAWPVRRVCVVLLALAGTGILLYPSAATWFSDRDHARAVARWAETTEEMPDPLLRRELATARAFNDALPPIPLQDPYGHDRGRVPAHELAAYEKTLAPDDDGVVAALRIPAIDVELPVRHGTAAATLARGVGHLYGSSLPVGGPGTHAVLTAHSGQVGATLFDRLAELSVGDEFEVRVLGEHLVYRVDSVRTVLPDEIESLARVPAADLVTLVTCTPTGVNSHRLLVRGRRVPGAHLPPASGGAATGGSVGAVPWWALGAAGTLLVLVVAGRRLAGRRRAGRRLAG